MQILNNLIYNSIKFTENGKISIEVSIMDYPDSSENLRIVFNIKDTGIGINENRLNALFEPFSQESTTIDKKYGGTGLGLALSKRLIELFHGEINVSSKIGLGSEFSFYLNVKKVIFISPTSEDNEEHFEVINFFSQKKINALVTDDNYINRKVLEMLLQKYNMNIITANDGEDAVSKIKHQCFDIVFMDILMPILNGKEATIEIRKILNSQERSIYIVGSTANVFEQSDLDGEYNMFDNFLTKPINRKQLSNVLNDYIKKSNP